MTERMIANVFLVKGDAEDVVGFWRIKGKHPRLYERMARAENLTVPLYVVVIDKDHS